MCLNRQSTGNVIAMKKPSNSLKRLSGRLILIHSQ